MSSTRYWMAAGALVIIAAIGFGVLRSRPQAVPPAPPQSYSPEPVTRTPPSVSQTELVNERVITLLGTIQSEAQAALSVRMPMRITRVSAHAGDNVRQNQILAELNPAEGRLQTETAGVGVVAANAQLQKAEDGRRAQQVRSESDIATAKAGVEQAEVKVKQALLARQALNADSASERTQAQEGVRKARLGLEHARETLKGLEELARVGGVSRNDLEGARLQVKIAESDLTTAISGAARLDHGPKQGSSYRQALADKDLEAARSGLKQAQAGLMTARAAKTETERIARQDVLAARAALENAQLGRSSAQLGETAYLLRSPIDGVVASVTAKTGEIAQPGMPLLNVVSLHGLRVEALVPGRQLPRLQLGQAARLSVDTSPGKSYTVRLKQIARVAEPDGRSFRVIFRFLQPPDLYPGQTARITLQR